MSPRPSSARAGRNTDHFQLSFPLSWLSESDFIDALRARGVRTLRRVRFKPNRTRLISLSPDNRTLNAHECFRGAPDDVLDAVSDFLRLTPGTTAQRRAVEHMRSWCEGQVADDDSVEPVRSAPAGTPEQLAFLATAYRRLNGERFAGVLPVDIPIRLSDRMSRRFGHVLYGKRKDDRHGVEEIALNIDLLIEGNERHLLDTLLHEMAHVEAWVVFGHRGHGQPWKSIARRLGCEVNASSCVRIRRRRTGVGTLRVPDLEGFLRAAATHGRARKRSRRRIAAARG
ncbi:MAG: SprT-like domain-containing protein [Longimicrobiales bacterium]